MDRTKLGAVSTVVGPALMSIGDLLHPAESWDPAAQVAMLTHDASRWYVAHLLLFIGFLLFTPGFLALSDIGASRRPATAYAARVLLIISVGALGAVFMFEMVLGQFIAAGGDHATAVTLLQVSQSPPVFAAVGPGLLAFFVGSALFVRSLTPLPPALRWPAYAFALGVTLILGEIVLAQVLLSQIGNVLIFVAGTGFARYLLHDERRVLASS